MGQAKQRGSHEQRIAAARARVDAIRPEKIICNHCRAEIAEVVDLDVRKFEGIDAAFAAKCTCKHVTYAFKGDPKAILDLQHVMENYYGQESESGIQKV